MFTRTGILQFFFLRNVQNLLLTLQSWIFHWRFANIPRMQCGVKSRQNLLHCIPFPEESPGTCCYSIKSHYEIVIANLPPNFCLHAFRIILGIKWVARRQTLVCSLRRGPPGPNSWEFEVNLWKEGVHRPSVLRFQGSTRIFLTKEDNEKLDLQ